MFPLCLQQAYFQVVVFLTDFLINGKQHLLFSFIKNLENNINNNEINKAVFIFLVAINDIHNIVSFLTQGCAKKECIPFGISIITYLPPKFIINITHPDTKGLLLKNSAICPYGIINLIILIILKNKKKNNFIFSYFPP